MDFSLQNLPIEVTKNIPMKSEALKFNVLKISSLIWKKIALLIWEKTSTLYKKAQIFVQEPKTFGSSLDR